MIGMDSRLVYDLSQEFDLGLGKPTFLLVQGKSCLLKSVEDSNQALVVLFHCPPMH